MDNNLPGKAEAPHAPSAPALSAEETRLHFALESAGLGVWDSNLITGECYYSPAWKRMLGYGEHELVDEGDLWLKLVHPDDRERAIESGKAHEEGRTPVVETEFRLRHKQGHWIWVLDRGRIIEWTADGKPARMVGAQTDITRQKEAEQHLLVLNERIGLAVETGGVGLWSLEIDTGVLTWDDRMHALYGTDPLTFRGDANEWSARLHPEDFERAQAGFKAAIEGNTQFSTVFRIVRPDGRIRHIRELARVVRSSGMAPIVVGTNWDVTDQVLAAQALADEKERLRITLQSIGEAVICTDVGNRVTFMNKAAEKLTQWPPALVNGLPLEVVFQPVHEDTGEPLPSTTQAAMSGRRTVEQEQHGVFVRGDGTRRSVRDVASPVITSTGDIMGSVLVIQDTTAARALQRDLAYAATHDMLTGLKGRVAFEAALAEAVASARNGAGRHALLYIDLDRFKLINDTAGHAAGDTLLKKVASAIKSAVHARDTVARLGGDEFAVLLVDCDPRDAERVGEKILGLIGNDRFIWAGKPYETGASIGLAVIGRDCENPEAVLACADAACYAAKAGGRNRLSVFLPDAGDARRHMSERRIASGVREAIGQNKFKLYAQEIRDLEKPLARGKQVEILTRMVAPDGSLIQPAAFIPAAERFDLMGALDRWVIENALETYGDRIMSIEGFRIAMNLSANSLSDPDLGSYVENQIAFSGIDPRRLVFEITETAVINNFTCAERFVAAVRAMGCGVSLDGFGSGVSSFAHLKRLKVDSIKIDGAFVENMHQSAYDSTIVRLIGEVAGEIGVEVIAERIQQPETVSILRSLGIRYGQGHIFHRPRLMDELLAEHGAKSPALPLAATG
ncbi:MAG: EAL domain-containing protein [Parvibaculaceae bacterium]